MLVLGKIYKYCKVNSHSFYFYENNETSTGFHKEIQNGDLILILQTMNEKYTADRNNIRTWDGYKIVSLRTNNKSEVGIIWCKDTYKNEFLKSFVEIV
jgi:hypothetical protein